MKLFHFLSLICLFAFVSCSSSERIPASDTNNAQTEQAEERYMYGGEAFVREGN
jgi:hypothetical protein